MATAAMAVATATADETPMAEPSRADTVPAAPADEAGARPSTANWAAVRDANIRPYAEWRAAPAVTLPVIAGSSGASSARPPQASFQHHPSSNGNNRGPHGGGRNGGGGNGGGGDGDGDGRAAAAGQAAAAAAVAAVAIARSGREGGDRNRDRGPRLPGFYNPGGD